MAESKKALKKQEAEMSTSVDLTVTDDRTEYELHAGLGFEEAGPEVFSIPFIKILQGLSPQLDTVEGAKPGLFFNTVTKRLSEELLFIPCYFRHEWIHWAPRSSGGGYKGAYKNDQVKERKIPGIVEHERTFYLNVPPGESPVDKEGKPKYDHLADTRVHFILVKDNEAWNPAVLSLGSTQIRKSGVLMSMLNGVKWTRTDGSLYTPAMFSHICRATTVKEKNAKGSWYGIEFTIVGRTPIELHPKAFEFYKTMKATQEFVPLPPQEDELESSDTF